MEGLLNRGPQFGISREARVNPAGGSLKIISPPITRSWKLCDVREELQHYCFVLISFYLSRCFNARVPKIPKFKKEMDEVLASIVGRSKKLLKQSPPSLVAVEGIILRHRSSAHLNIQGHTKSHRDFILYTRPHSTEHK